MHHFTIKVTLIFKKHNTVVSKITLKIVIPRNNIQLFCDIMKECYADIIAITSLVNCIAIFLWRIIMKYPEFNS
jgi:hypothetical protein